MTQFETKDSGKREEYESGMRRDVQEGKARFDLLVTDGLPYDEQFLYRFASLLSRGATKYGERNWQLADSDDELSRFRASGFRHFMQWMCGETDEDHAAAVAFNLMAAEYVKWKLANATEEVSTEVEDSSSGDPYKLALDGLRQEGATVTGRIVPGSEPGLPGRFAVQPDFVRVCKFCDEIHSCGGDSQGQV